MTTLKWEFYQDAGGEWRWRATASNGEIVGTSHEGYKNKEDCEANAHLLGNESGLQKFIHKFQHHTLKWEFYKDAKTEHRWRVTSPNGEIVGASNEGYKNKADCETNARHFGYKG